MPATALYHLTLGGRGLIIDLTSYKRSVADPFSSKQATGNRQYDDLRSDQDQVLAQDDFSGGERLVRVVAGNPRTRFRSGTAIDVFSKPGAFRLGKALAVSHQSSLAKIGLALFEWRDGLYSGGSDGSLWRSQSGGGWTQVDTFAAGEVGAIAEYDGKLYYSNTADGKVRSSANGTTWAQAFEVAAADAAGIRAMLGGVVPGVSISRLYLVADDVSGQARVYYWDGTTLSAFQYAMLERYSRGPMLFFNKSVYFFGADTPAHGAIYSFDLTNFRIERFIPDNYVTSAAWFQDWLYLGMFTRGEVWRYKAGSGGSLELAFRIPREGAAWSFITWSMCVFQGALWIVSGRIGGLPGIWRWDGQSLSIPYQGLTSIISGLAVAPHNGDLFVGTDVGSNAVVEKTLPSTFRTSATLETAVEDAGLPSVDKVWREVTVTHSPLAAGDIVEVLYRLEDTGAFTSLGSSDTDGATSKTLPFTGNVTGKLIAFQIKLTVTGTSASPEFRSLVIRFGLAPTVRRQWEFEAVLDGTAAAPQVRLDGTAEPDSAEVISDDLWTKRSTAGTLTLVDLDGASYTVWFTDLEDHILEAARRSGERYRPKITLLEA